MSLNSSDYSNITPEVILGIILTKSYINIFILGTDLASSKETCAFYGFVKQ